MRDKIFGLSDFFGQAVLDELIDHDHESPLLQGLVLTLAVLKHHLREERMIALKMNSVYVLIEFYHLYLAVQSLPIVRVIFDVFLYLFLHFSLNTRNPVLDLRWLE